MYGTELRLEVDDGIKAVEFREQVADVTLEKIERLLTNARERVRRLYDEGVQEPVDWGEEVVRRSERLVLLEAEVGKLQNALSTIARQDYRGNRPSEQSMAEQALRQSEERMGGATRG